MEMRSLCRTEDQERNTRNVRVDYPRIRILIIVLFILINN